MPFYLEVLINAHNNFIVYTNEQSQSLPIYKHILAFYISVYTKTTNTKCNYHVMRAFVTGQWHVRLECSLCMKLMIQILCDVTLCRWVFTSQHLKVSCPVTSASHTHPKFQSLMSLQNISQSHPPNNLKSHVPSEH
jgi:hypothetical protein